MANQATAGPTVALGVLSSAGSAGTATTSDYVYRRTTVREGLRGFDPSVLQRVAVRFLLAGTEVTKPHRNNVKELRMAREENRTHGDMIFLDMEESRFMCGKKSLLWFQHCELHFPSAQYYALGDDDSYVQLEHLEADLLSLPADSYLLWGLTMWEAFYNRKAMVTHSSWGGWRFFDYGAVYDRHRMDRCRAINSTDLGECKQMSKSAKEALRSGEYDPDFAPWPMVNAATFAVSRRLGNLLAHDTVPTTYLDELMRTPLVVAATSRRHGPKKSSFACWPLQDSMLGYWISKISLERGTHIHLANSPFMVQHHPWPSDGHGAFSNASVMVHGFKRPGANRLKLLAFARQRGSGPFIPYKRTCGDCASMGWSTWPGSHIHRWTCCGDQAPKAEQSPAQQKGRRRRAKGLAKRAGAT